MKKARIPNHTIILITAQADIHFSNNGIPKIFKEINIPRMAKETKIPESVIKSVLHSKHSIVPIEADAENLKQVESTAGKYGLVDRAQKLLAYLCEHADKPVTASYRSAMLHLARSVYSTQEFLTGKHRQGKARRYLQVILLGSKWDQARKTPIDQLIKSINEERVKFTAQPVAKS